VTTVPVLGLDPDILAMTLASIRDFARDRLPDERLRALDDEDTFPADVVRAMCGDELGIQLLFIDEQFGGMGGGAFDVYRVCEQMAGVDLGIATGVLATFLGSDPIVVGGTPEQKRTWLGAIADRGVLFAYGATEPEAGSDLGSLRTTATGVEEDGRLVGYRLTGRKQGISNGGVADHCCVLANAPGGPSWFVVDAGTPGFAHGRPENKHGIRASNTAALMLDDVVVDVDRLVGGVEGQGLLQAQQVFGYTRLMVAAFGLGAGWAALERAVAYSQERIQAGSPLSEKQGYTHKLIVPSVVRLEVARACIEETARRIDAGEGSLNTEGAVAKYLASEAGNLAADAAIQAHGGYGYTHEFMVEKIKRDVRITTIYEGTSEIMEMTIARDRWQLHLKTRGEHYREEGRRLDELHAARAEVGADVAALAMHALAGVLEGCRVARLTRNQHVLLRLGELIAAAEGAAAMVRRAVDAADSRLGEKADHRFRAAALACVARVAARDAALLVAEQGLRWTFGGDGTVLALADLERELRVAEVHAAQAGLLADMDRVADAVYGRVPTATTTPPLAAVH
jgi:alkylation response protein AidB-like acyl-CoA dehydrogenase